MLIYKVEFTGADIFPQGFAAVADRLYEFSGTNMLCDIGNGDALKHRKSTGKYLRPYQWEDLTVDVYI